MTGKICPIQRLTNICYGMYVSLKVKCVCVCVCGVCLGGVWGVWCVVCVWCVLSVCFECVCVCVCMCVSAHTKFNYTEILLHLLDKYRSTCKYQQKYLHHFLSANNYHKTLCKNEPYVTGHHTEKIHLTFFHT
jgi:hypothetical protein